MTPLGPAKPSLTSFLEVLRSSGGLRFEYTIHSRDADPSTAQPPLIEVTLSGPDTPLLLERNGDLLHAIESLAAAILRLEPEQVDQLSFDAGDFKAERVAAIQATATAAVTAVQASSKPFIFPPMNARERRLLHLALVPSGLATASSGVGPRRFVVLYPAGQTPDPDRFEQPVRRPDRFRNHGSYKPRTPSGASGNTPVRPLSEAAPLAALAAEVDPDSHGNRLDAAAATPEGDTTTKDRLDSIRRAFRKR
jgi:spoIIIJ-associated protein